MQRRRREGTPFLKVMQLRRREAKPFENDCNFDGAKLCPFYMQRRNADGAKLPLFKSNATSTPRSLAFLK